LQELEGLGSSYGQLKEVQEQFYQNVATLVSIKTAAQNTEMLVPLTNTVMVPAKVNDNGRVLVDIGTGYYVSRTVADADSYYVRKIKYLQEQLNALGQLIQNRRQNLMVVQQMLQPEQQ